RVQQEIPGKEIPGTGIAEIVRGSELGDGRTETEGEHEEAGGERGIEPQRTLCREARERARLLPALRHEIAADDEEHEAADDAEDRLPARERHQRLPRFLARRQQKRMREDHRTRREEPQSVEVVATVERRVRRRLRPGQAAFTARALSSTRSFLRSA